MSDEDYNSDSDKDYVPSDGEALSEEENSGDEEDLSLLKEDVDGEGEENKQKGKKKQRKCKGIIEKRKRKGGIILEGDDLKQSKEENEEEKARKKELEEQIATGNEQKKQIQEKKRADELWSSFLSDVGTLQKPKPVTALSATSGSLASLSQPVNKDLIKSSDSTTTKMDNKVKVTKVFDFAGEEVKITKEVDVHSKEGQEELKKQNEDEKSGQESGLESECYLGPKTAGTVSGPTSVGIKRPAVGGGLGNVLNKINKKQKISTLDKSKLDWESFKDKEGISDDLALHNRGKSSYIERQNFLNRTDYRQFEIEKNLRLSNSKR